ncbi:MAG: excinuclease ABC subunit UvrC [Acidimicrobiia bacterium]
MVTRPAAGTIPDAPGSYQFLDADGRVIYVGKAKSLRSRLNSYFADPLTLAPRTRQMVQTADHVEWFEVRTEVEALLLEFNLIKTHRPRFNVRLKDDKSYPYLAVTTDEAWPRAQVMRGAKRKGVRYFGPYTHAWAIRETLDLLLRTFPIRTCTNAKLQRHARLGKPCLYAHIEKCAAPCVDAITPEAYAQLVEEFVAFLDGRTAPVLDRLEKAMHEASDALEFERAARLRDQILSVQRVIERQEVVGSSDDNVDVLGVADDPLEAAIEMLMVRRGRVVGRRSVMLDKVEDLDAGALNGRLVELLYADAPREDVPREVLLTALPDAPGVYEALLAQRRNGPASLRVPQRGSKKALLDMANKNATDALARQKLRRASDHNARAQALTALQDALGLADAPLRIECFDISHLQGTEMVASMVVMEDGLPKRNDYRHFKLRHGEGNDDFLSMEEVLTRRFTRLLEERAAGPIAGKRFAYPPNLLLIDGGKGQLGVAVRVLEELGLSDDIEVASLAKRFEEVYRPGQSEPVRIARDSPALHLLQQVRDEAHRFAITYHRRLRDKKMTTSVLDEVAGLGPNRRARLLKQYGSLKKLRAASLDELHTLPWLPDAVADAVFTALHPEGVPRVAAADVASLGTDDTADTPETPA